MYHIFSNLRSHHLQLQVVPVKKECTEAAKSAFMDVGDSQDVELLEVPEHSSLSQMVQPGAPYFYAELPCKTRLFHRVRSGFPIQVINWFISVQETLLATLYQL